MTSFKEFNKRTVGEVIKLSERGIHYDFKGGYWFGITPGGAKKLLNKEEVHNALKIK